MAREIYCTLKDQNLSIVVTYSDLSKASDSYLHIWLLPELDDILFRSDSFVWIKNFLVGRQKRVQVNSKLSSWELCFVECSRVQF